MIESINLNQDLPPYDASIVSHELISSETLWPEFQTDDMTNPIAHPEAFSEFVTASLASVGVDDPYDVIMAGIDGTELEKTKTLGDRTSTFALPGDRLRLDARQAAQEGRWPQHSSVHYAQHFHDSALPMIVAFDRTKMQRNADSCEEFTPVAGNIDDAIVAVFRLPVASKTPDVY